MSNQPIHTFKDGSVTIKLWEQGSEQTRFATASIGKLYQDKRTGEWREGKSFSEKDMQKLQELLPAANQELQKWNEYYRQVSKDQQQVQEQAEPTQEPALKAQPPAQPVTHQNDMLAARDAAMQAAQSAPDKGVPAHMQEQDITHTR